MKTYRVSGDPLAMLCPASAWSELDPFEVRWVNFAGNIGTAAHEAAFDIVMNDGEYPSDEDFEGYIKSNGLTKSDLAELQVLATWTCGFWRHWGDSFPNPQLEQPLATEYRQEGGFVRSGHPDLFSLIYGDEPREARILDWKSTRLHDIDYWAQMKGYCVLLSHKYPTLENYKCVAVYLRDQEIDVRHYNEEDIKRYQQEFIEKIVKWDKRTYNPGGQCRFCPRALHCEAQTALVRSAARTLMLDMGDILGEMTPAELVTLYQHSQVVGKRIEEFRGHMRVMVEASENRRIRGDNNYDLALIDQKPRDIIDLQKGWTTMVHYLDEVRPTDVDGDEDGNVIKRDFALETISEIVTVPKTRLLESYGAAWKESTGLTKGVGAAKKQFMEDLELAGAVGKKPMEAQLKVVKRK